MLTIPEEMTLLRLASAGRSTAHRKRDLYAADKPIAAARLAELALVGRLAVKSSGRYLLSRDALVVNDPTPTGDRLLDEVLDQVAAKSGGSCARWISRLAKGSLDAYWDRLITTSCVRPDPLTVGAVLADPDIVDALIGRIRAVLAGAESTDLRDVALVTLLAHTQSLFGLLNDITYSPAGLARAYRTQRHDDALGKTALDRYCRARSDSASPSDDAATASSDPSHAIQRIVQAAADAAPQSGPG